MSRPPFRILGVADRLGGVLVAPRATLLALQRGGRGGVEDVAILFAVQVVALQLPLLVRTLWFAAAVDPGTGLMNLLNLLFQAALVPLLVALVGSVALNWATPTEVDRSRNLDAASLCVAPLLALQVVGSYLMMAGGPPAAPWVARGVLGGGAVWTVALMVTMGRLLRSGDPALALAPAQATTEASDD